MRLKHFLANEWHRQQAQKRGGQIAILELDSLDPETRYALEPSHSDDPDAGFDRQWAQEMVARAMDQLRREFEENGKSELFEALKGSLAGEEPPRCETAESLGMTEGAVKVAVHRLRNRFREILRGEIAETVTDSSEIDDEMRHLVNALRKLREGS